jgi:predicted O-methyltransferase YrrM
MNPRLKGFLAPIVDITIAPIAFFIAPLAAHLAKHYEHYPMSLSIFDRANVAFVRHHYYAPIVLPSDIRFPLDNPRDIVGLDMNEEGQLALIRSFNYHDELLTIPIISNGRREFFYKNNAFEFGDAEYLYNIVRHFKPKRLIEIGCGYSTLMARRAILRNKEEDVTYSCEHVCIEPFEQPWLEELDVRVIRSKVEDIQARYFKTLISNDIVFIDSSHVIRPQGDVLYEYLQLIGTLAPGVIVHVHDVFTPRDYLEQWVIRERRLWNEQYILEAFLCYNTAFEIIGALNWLSHEHRDKLENACPMLLRNPEATPGSFWFRRVS